MAKRKTGISSNKVVQHPHKTKKRLAVKKVMLEKKAAKKVANRSKTTAPKTTAKTTAKTIAKKTSKAK